MNIGKYNIHLHSISVHFTTSLYPVAAFFLGLSYACGDPSFRSTYYYMMILATLSCPVSYVTGLAEWKQKFKGKTTPRILHKIRYGIALTLLGALCTAWYGLFPEVLSAGGVMQAVFIAVNLAVQASTFLLGHIGGKLAFHTPQQT